ncbi:MAG TPA: cytochrome P460 family protein [Pyrinomonadaceae bacterium]|jgi:hypothetical protein
MKTGAKTQYAKLLIIIFLAGMWACASLSPQKLKLAASSPAIIQPTGAEIIEGYRQWTRVNPEPAIFHAQIAALCAAPTAARNNMEAGNPHLDKFITVYVNDIGKRAMMEEKSPRFPQGSVIVKEKLMTKESTSPELLTVMIKREAGFNPDNGDWEYMSLNGTGKEVQARGRLESCQACHMMVKDTDYVSRNYLPIEVRAKLK